MSLIACTSNYGFPFLIGDLLISTDEKQEAIELPIPAFDVTPFFPEGMAGYPITLHQKIYKICDNLCVALAGNVWEMAEFLKNLKIRCSYFDAVTERDIRNFLDEYLSSDLFERAAVFIMLVEPEGTQLHFKQFYFPQEKWLSDEGNSFEQIMACGSGKEQFIFQSKADDKIVTATGKGTIYRALSIHMAFLTKLMAVESISTYMVKDRWGGGFEFMFYDGKTFTKFDTIAYVIFHGNFDNNGDIGEPKPRSILYQEYVGEVLYLHATHIRSWYFEEIDGRVILESADFDSKLFAILPIDRGNEISADEVPYTQSYKTHRVSFGYALISPSNGIYSPSYFSESFDTIVEYEDSQRIKISFNANVHNTIQKGAKQVYPNL